MDIIIRYYDKRTSSGFVVEHFNNMSHEGLTKYFIKHKKRKIKNIEIFNDTEIEYTDKREWTYYHSLEEYMNRESKGKHIIK